MTLPTRSTAPLLLLLIGAAGGFLAGTGVPAAGQERPLDREPPLLLQLAVDGQKVDARLDVPLEIETPGKTTTLTVSALPHREFDFGGISFRYPSRFVFEADLSDPEVPTWTVEGASAVVIVTRHGGSDDDPALLRAATAANVRSAYGAGTRVDEVEWKLGETSHPGTRVRARIAGTSIVQTVFGFEVKDGRTLVVFQDCPQDDGTPSEESLHAFAMIMDSFRLPE